uniref:PH01B001G05.19 protein n=1 Tax=Phyllostachys edulis TaxID=38705 RepID=L0P1J8_PHYED|nr:PH01B001G05.19 [Phyllostachys edulis]
MTRLTWGWLRHAGLLPLTWMVEATEEDNAPIEDDGEVKQMVPEPTDNQVSQHLEAYLLWLFCWVLFTSSHGDFVDACLVGYARTIADGKELQISWRSVVLATAYHNSSPYDTDMYHGDAVDRSTVGALWCRRWVTHVYEHFVEQLDRLTADDVCWAPYSDQETEDCAPEGLSSMCWCNRAYRRTQKKLVFDIFVEDYAVHKVMHQFGLRQVVPVLIGMRVPDSTHARTSTSGWPGTPDRSLKGSPTVRSDAGRDGAVCLLGPQWGEACSDPDVVQDGLGGGHVDAYAEAGTSCGPVRRLRRGTFTCPACTWASWRARLDTCPASAYAGGGVFITPTNKYDCWGENPQLFAKYGMTAN